MSQPYDPKTIEPKWQKYWEERGMYRAEDFSKKPKQYVLDMFPYPSGEGLHVGHVEGYTATDVMARFFRMRGKNVLHPMGWDAFGLPAENYAIKTKTHPRKAVEGNVAQFKKVLQRMGFSYDWSREINTTDPEYYKWTQWIFLQLYKKGLAYEAEAPINFCPKDGTALADEEVVNGCCERCGTVVERRFMKQWMLKITEYADRLLEDLAGLEWPEHIKEMQRNWIGRSEGSEIAFKVQDASNKKQISDLAVFTTRADTLFGATYVVVAPEHPLFTSDQLSITNYAEVKLYIEQAKQKTDIERQEHTKSGVRVEGVTAVNPVNNTEIPIFVADYVLGTYGTGAIMAVPAHDNRDFAFAQAHDLPIVEVISPDGRERKELDAAFTDDGILVNSAQFSGKSSRDARKAITVWLAEKKLAKTKIYYKLRDWIFSRQRYWGEPIPIVHCQNCGIVPVPEEQLPVLLPDVEHYEPTGTGESPLARIAQWVNTKCPNCDGPAQRETNTMPQWAGSCWYYLRFMDPGGREAFVDKEKEKYWAPVDLYMGGAEHAVLHLLYARFWHKVLFDLGHVSTKEPFYKLRNQGMILGPDNQKMSKSRGNVVPANETIDEFGADTLRMYELFLGPIDDVKPWDTKGIIGIWRFLNKVYNLAQNNAERHPSTTLRASAEQRGNDALMHKTIKKVTEDIEKFRFNTAISTLMEYVNELSHLPPTTYQLQILVLLLAPFAPHLAEELWQVVLKKEGSVHEQDWPKYDPAQLEETEATVVVQVSGRTRGQVRVRRGAVESEVRKAAEEEGGVARHLVGKTIRRVVFVPDKLINIVVE